ncbi:sugar kinase [Erysipelothrix sp. HDW6C]|uniref:sugar kinase n=1 Tax=Erysipelothrix sp. HDW6C TaxID=2714930 RepID=UPI00140B6792|nr:sugar kinase [Erysipelothrix sp. HDW6C]QIK69303.1 sugar kinase [Erysipelothrix sp. HDW6C]
MSDVLLFGEAMALFVADEVGSLVDVNKYTRTIAGAEVNVAVGLSRLGHDVTYLTRLGNDSLGKYITNFLVQEGIDIRNISYDSVYRTGIQLKNKVEKGDAYAPYFRKGSAASQIDASIVDTIDFSQFKLIHVTGIALAISPSFRELSFAIVRQARDRGITISFDPNLRPKLWDTQAEMIATINEMATYADIILPGISEGQILTGEQTESEIAAFYHHRGVRDVVIKIGDQGSYVSGQNIEKVVPGFKVDTIVDTVGAGDGFAAGLISGIIEKLSLEEAVKRANAIGAIQVTHWSDNEGLPTHEELIAFMDSKSQRCA